MSMLCWKAIGLPQDVPSPNLLTTFDGHFYRPHRSILAFLICVGGKVVNIEVEIVDVNLDYNLLLGKNWIYEMDGIVSSLFASFVFLMRGGLPNLIRWTTLRVTTTHLLILLFH